MANPQTIATRGAKALVPRRHSAIAEFFSAIAVVGIATLIGWPLYHKAGIANANVLMIYLLGVLWIATHYSRLSAVFTSILSVLAFDFIFVPPYYTLDVHDQQYLVTFVVMLATALLISTLTHRLRAKSEAARIAWEHAEAEFLRNTLLSGVSHELRTPLAGITGAASAISDAGDGLSPRQVSEMLETIRDEAERMERLIDNLLDMARLESGKPLLRKEWLPLQEIIGSALHHLDRRLRSRVVKIDLPTDLPLVELDAIAIQQVLINLIDNAMRYTPPGSPIDIAASTENGYVSIEVADRGAGLPPGTEQRVFEKFFRVRPSENRPGTGLGLAICREIAKAHGGEIAACNRAGGGAIFRIALPCTNSPPFVDATK